MNIKNLSLNSWYEFKVTPVLKNHAEGVVAGTTSPPGGPYRTLCSGMHTILRKDLRRFPSIRHVEFAENHAGHSDQFVQI